MRIDVLDMRTNEKLDKNILEFVNTNIHAVQVESGWHVVLNDIYRSPEVFETKSDAIRELNGLKRSIIRAQENERIKASIKDEPVSNLDDEDDS